MSDSALYRITQSRARLPSLFLLGTFSLLLLCLSGHAQNQQAEEESTSAHQLMFIPPPKDGVISLGVYDNGGKLIRILKKAADIDSFRSGLNGLFIDWDGKDSNGAATPAGKYSARGILVGEVNVSGQAYHLNDWVDPSGSVQARRILSAAFLTGKTVCAFAEIGAGRALLIANGNGRNHAAALPSGTNSIKFDGVHVVAICDDRLVQLDPTSASLVGEKAYADLHDADQWRGKWIVLAGNQLFSSTEGGNQSISPPGDHLAYCAQLDSSPIVASQNGNLWKLEDHHFRPIETGDTGAILDLSAGKGDTIWLLLQVGSKRFLRQVDLSGQRIRELDLPPDLQAARRLCGSRDDEDLLLTVDLNPGERVVGLHFQNSKAQQSVWQKWLDRSITPFHYFDIKNGEVVAAPEKTDSPTVSVQLAENALEDGAAGNLALVVTADESGAWISSSDGLPLLPVAKTKNIIQTKWAASGPDSLRVFVSDGSVVEEYQVTGLKNLYRFDAGSFD